MHGQFVGGRGDRIKLIFIENAEIYPSGCTGGNMKAEIDYHAL